MSFSLGIGLFLLGFALGAAVVWLLRKGVLQSSQSQLEALFGSLSREALDRNQHTFLELARSQFESLLKSSDGQLDAKKKLIDASLGEMKTKLESLTRQTSELKGQVEQSHQGISRLSDTTSQLRQILSSSQARGQWGERMVEDILNFIGLAEGLNYTKQTPEGDDVPDYTFYLPRERHINMDVKFPLTHYEAYLGAASDQEREVEKKQFISDVRGHIRDVARRSYINPAGGTVDYVLVFIPNEGVYTFLNQEDSELIDFSLSQKIILCSPITLYAVLSLVRQAVSNFTLEKKAGEMQQLVQVFQDQWEKFVQKMDRLGATLGTAQKHYEDLSITRAKQLDKPMEKIIGLQLGSTDQPEKLEE